MGLVSESRRYSGGGNGNPLQYSFLENPMDRRALWATVWGLKSQRGLNQLSTHTKIGKLAYSFCSVSQSCVTLCNPMYVSTPDFPVLYHLPEFAQTHVLWVSDAIQPSHPLSIPSHSAFNFSQQSWSFPMSWFFISGGQSIGASASASVLPMNIHGWFPLGLTCLISWLSKGLSRVFSNTTVPRHQFLCAQPFFYCPALTFVHDHWKNHSFD